MEGRFGHGSPFGDSERRREARCLWLNTGVKGRASRAHGCGLRASVKQKNVWMLHFGKYRLLHKNNAYFAVSGPLVVTIALVS